MFNKALVLLGLLALSACNTMPKMNHYTANGTPCHAIGYSWNPVWVTPDGSKVCW